MVVRVAVPLGQIQTCDSALALDGVIPSAKVCWLLMRGPQGPTCQLWKWGRGYRPLSDCLLSPTHSAFLLSLNWGKAVPRISSISAFPYPGPGLDGFRASRKRGVYLREFFLKKYYFTKRPWSTKTKNIPETGSLREISPG